MRMYKFKKVPFDILNLLGCKFAVPKGSLYVSSMPFSPLFDPDGQLLQEYWEENISKVVVLVSRKEILEVTGRDLLEIYKEAGFELITFPIKDHDTPELHELSDFIGVVHSVLDDLRSGKNIVVHCHAGIGRTGIFVASLLILLTGCDLNRILDFIELYVGSRPENAKQRKFLSEVVKARNDISGNA